jgi:Xaa-Pro aminopeptidase
MHVKEKLKALRAEMKKRGVHCYWVPSTDAHQNEYLPDFWQRRSWLTGFTGSAGNALITQTSAGVWTDARYFLQAQEQLRGTGIKLYRMGEAKVPTILEFLEAELDENKTFGFDPKLVSISQYRRFLEVAKNRKSKLVGIEHNLIDSIWLDQGQAPQGSVHLQPTKFSGEGVKAKLKRVRRRLKEVGAQAHVLSTLDSIAWLFNIRGRDVDYNPVAISYAVVTLHDAYLCIDDKKLSAKVRSTLEKVASLHAYEDVAKILRVLDKSPTPVLLDSQTCNRWIAQKFRRSKVIEGASPVVAMKSRKNKVEIEGMRQSHIRDGVAVTRFLRWLSEAVPKGGVSELSAAKKLEKFRSEGTHFVGLSFQTISGYAAHGAIVHYGVTEESNIPLKSTGLYLVDSGGQYYDGTTDITRTLCMGEDASSEEKACFTRVLKGHIALGRAVFPQGTNGMRLDVLARTALWEAGLDYGHGTGHGVGSHLNVHEGPQSISVKGHVPLEAGNILSNEPGYYRDGHFGIRIESLVLVYRDEALSKDEQTFLRFENLTMAPIDTKLVDTQMLSAQELSWLNDYHQRVYKTLSPHLRNADRRWLKAQTKSIH